MKCGERSEDQPELAVADAIRDATDAATANDEKGAPTPPCRPVKAPEAHNASNSNNDANGRKSFT